MAANEFTFWDNGFPSQFADNGLSVNELTFWDNGFPYQDVFPQAAPGGSLIKTWFGLANASTKTKNGLANASIKTDIGLTNV
jgi:hypothetical protein